MNKKSFLIVFFIIIIMSLASCTNNGTITSITINKDSFKQEYAIDEQINYNNSYLTIRYSDGSTSRMKIKSDMVSGFDSSITGFEKTLTVTFRGYSATFIYNVRNSFEIATSLRLKAEVTSDKILFSLSPMTDFPHGIFGITFLIDDYLVKDLKLFNEDIFKATYKNNDNFCEIICYSYLGDAFISESPFLEITLNRPINSLTVTEITVNEGFNDIRLPNILI